MAYPVNIPVIPKDPSADLDYGFDLSPSATQLIKPWLAVGEQVTNLVVTADDGISVLNSSINANSNGVPASLLVAWLSGGTLGATYNVHFEFTTNQGRTDTRSMQIVCQQR
ncbi:hypothetical protein [Pararobbsia alpina]|uniref:Ig-like domain-containing protein n=1 Tax=Pararobbsia alpina TaxID=621374 RepID=A0A6S7B143_9BURK|nr:hypothetical protein [Pararobbsia alpina]CAB3784199.1 hypothetical protein LMG28138_01761 [Pararobbsia alpina]